MTINQLQSKLNAMELKLKSLNDIKPGIIEDKFHIWAAEVYVQEIKKLISEFITNTKGVIQNVPKNKKGEAVN